MLGIFTRFRKVGVQTFGHGILPAMSQLSSEGRIALLAGVFLFHGAFFLILVFRTLHDMSAPSHECTKLIPFGERIPGVFLRADGVQLR